MTSDDPEKQPSSKTNEFGTVSTSLLTTLSSLLSSRLVQLFLLVAGMTMLFGRDRVASWIEAIGANTALKLFGLS